MKAPSWAALNDYNFEVITIMIALKCQCGTVLPSKARLVATTIRGFHIRLNSYYADALTN